MAHATELAIAVPLALASCAGGHVASSSHAPTKAKAAAQSARVGARAVAMLQGVPGAPVPAPRTSDRQVDRPLGDIGQPITGTATFIVIEGGVDLTLSILGCNAPSAGYTLEIMAGDDCSDASLAGAVWDAPRGTQLPPLYCGNTGGVGRLYFTLPADSAKPWSVGAPTASDLVGHALVIRDPEFDAAVSCGVIALADTQAADAGTSAVQDTPLAVKAAVAGICLTRMFPGANDSCPDPQALVDCASTHCQLDACVAQCGDYVACLGAAPDGCSAGCAASGDCLTCTSNVAQCLFGFCADLIQCAPPITPDGPCSKVEACCQTQGDFTQRCLALAHQLESLGGDPSCVGAMGDWDFNSHLPVLCSWQ